MAARGSAGSALSEQHRRAGPTRDQKAVRSHAGFKSFTSAETTVAGIELAHRIHKGQFAFGSPHDGASLKHLWDRALADVDAPREDSRGGLSPSTANAPELRSGKGRPGLCSSEYATCNPDREIRAKVFRRWGLVSARCADGRSILALQLPLQR